MRPLCKKVPERSREIVEIFRDVVKATSQGCSIITEVRPGVFSSMQCPKINYVFGNSRYVKDNLDELSKTPLGAVMKFPMIVLFCPIKEKRGLNAHHGIASVNVLISYSTRRQYSNEERCVYSFRNVLRPIYNRFIESLKADGRLEFTAEGNVPHEYSENYSYGRYGALTNTGEDVGEPIDAINITNLEIKVKNQTCR